MTTTRKWQSPMTVSRATRAKFTALRCTLIRLLVALAIVAIPAERVLAQYYLGAGSSGDWDDVGNWLANEVPPNDGTALILIAGGMGGSGHDPVIDHTWNIEYLEFYNSGFDRQWTLGGSGLLNVDYLGIGVYTPIDVPQTVTADVGLVADQNWNISGFLHVSGQISGSHQLEKSGTGTLLLSAANTYSGGTTIQFGTLQTGADHVIPSGQVILEDDTTLDLDGHVETIGPGGVSTTGLIMYGSAQILNADNFTVSTLGTFIDYRAGFGDGQITGTMRLATNTIPRTISVEDDSSVEDLVIYANISNQASNPNSSTADINKTGAGTLSLYGNNTFWRHVDVSEGTLRIGSDTALGNTAGDANTGTNVASGATLGLVDDINVANEHLTIAGTGVGGAGALVNVSGNNTWGGDVVLAADSTIGVPNVNQDLTISSDISGTAGLTKIGSGQLNLPGTKSFTGNMTIESGRVSVDTLANAGMPSGIGAGSAVTLNASGAWLQYTGPSVEIDRDFVIDSGNCTIYSTTGELTLAGTISGTGSVNFSGTIVPTGTNTFTGLAAIQTLSTTIIDSITNSGVAGPMGAGSFMFFGPGATLQFTGASGSTDRTIQFSGSTHQGQTVDVVSGELTLGGLIYTGSSANDLVKAGAGTLILTHANTYANQTVVAAGTLLANNLSGSATGTGTVQVNSGATLGGNGSVSGDVTVESGGTLAPGSSAGMLSVGGVTFDTGSLFDVEFTGNGGVPGVDFDQLVVGGGTGDANLNGTFNAILGGSFDPTPGETYEVMTFGSRTGEFSEHTGLGLMDDSFLLPQYTDTSLTIVSLIPGDASLDGQVDIGDFTIWGDGFGTGSQFADGDFSGDGVVDIGDFTIWGDHFGELVSSPGGGLTAVPEPSTWVLLLIGAIGLFFVRRRRG